MAGLRVLVIGSGGREHAVVWAVARSPRVRTLYACPGNGGMADLAELVALSPLDAEALARFAERARVDLTIVGPEAPLVAGIVEVFEARGLRVFGPRRAAAALEGSKVFAKTLMQRVGVPTAPFEVCTDPVAAGAAARRWGGPVVIKADGLCGGKGVVVCATPAEADAAIELMMVRRAFGAAGDRVVVEERLDGEEASCMAVVDGTTFQLLASAQDHKRLLAGDRGPNTGGMGAYSPAPVVTDHVSHAVAERVFAPTLRALADQGVPFRGILYAGLMLTRRGPLVLEFNVRFGDPEAQVVLPRLKTDLVDVVEAALTGQLGAVPLTWDPQPCLSVVVASQGYPGEYATGRVITGLGEAQAVPGVLLFHAGTQRAGGHVVTAGGRVVDVTALGRDLDEAARRAYQAVRAIQFDGMIFREDIGHRAWRSSSARSA